MFGPEGRREALLHLLIDARIVDPVQVEGIVKARKVGAAGAKPYSSS
jgi:hypothetical protein